jgi:hypothetical protein
MRTFEPIPGTGLCLCLLGVFQDRGDRPEPRGDDKAHRQGKGEGRLHFGPDLAARVGSQRTALVQVIVAGTNSNTASLVQSYSLQIFERFNRSRLEKLLHDRPSLKKILPAGPQGIVRPEIRVWYNSDLVSRNFYVPGIISLVIMVSVLNLTAMAVVREKEVGTMEQIMVTPIKPVEFILGKTIPFALIGIFQVALVGTVGVFWFGVPMRGSLIASLRLPPHLSPVHSFPGTIHLHHQPQPAAGARHHLFLHLPHHPPLGFYLSHRQHARSSSGSPT